MSAAPQRPVLALVASVPRNRVVGRGDELVFKEPADLRHFRAVTVGHPVIMGRKTWDSLPPKFRPLPGRRNVVVSRNGALQAPGAEVVADLNAALALLAGEPRASVIGGGEIFAQALPLADELVLTEIDADLEGDRFFPPWDRDAFELVSQQPERTADGVDYRFSVYRRR